MASTRTRWHGCAVTECRQTHYGSARPILSAVRRGILGGTFDPPHYGHLFMGEVAYGQLRLDVVTFLPAGAPWQKNDRSVADPQRRLEMTRLAIAGVDYFEADAREVERDGWTYTADTLGTFPNHEELFLILGADAAARLPTWQRFQEVLDRARIAVMPRPGSTFDHVAAALGTDGFEWLDGPEFDVSGTVIRERLGAGKSIRFLLPDAVRTYAASVGLHRETSG